MTMHLAHPAFTTNGKKKGKQKFRSATAAQKSRELKDDWDKLQKKWEVDEPTCKGPMKTLKISYAYRGQSDKPKSLDTGIGVAALKEQKVYTGTKMIGIGQLHKSNAVPVFSTEEAIDIAHMRR